MNSSSSIPPSCLSCYRSYATDNLPRTAKCGHTYCEKCLKILTQCPMDQNIIDNTLPISSYPINMAVAKCITRTHNTNTQNSSNSLNTSGSSGYKGFESSYQSQSGGGSGSLPTASSFFSQNGQYKPKLLSLDSYYQSSQPPPSNPSSQFPPYFSNYSSTQSYQPTTPPIEKPPTPPVVTVVPQRPPSPPQNTHKPVPITQINPQKQQQKQICALHNKQIDLICLDDGIAICSNCALFGDHKLHNIKTIQNSLNQCSGVAEKTLNVLSQIKELQSTINMKSVQDKIDSICKQKKIKLSAEIKAYYQKILSKVISAQKQSNLELQKVIEEERSALRQQLISANKQKKRKQWIQQASSLIKQAGSAKTDGKDLQKICKFLDKGNKEDTFLKQGQYILVELNSFARLSEQKINSSFNDITISKENVELEKLIKQGCKISRGGEEIIENKYVSPQKVEDDLLLDSLATSQLTKRVHTFSVDTHNQFNEMIFDHFQERLNTQNSHQKSSEQRQKTKTDRQRINPRIEDRIKTQKEPFGTYNGQSRKKKKIKVPQKYQQAVQDLRNDRAQIIDFTNADLGDAGMIPIFDLLRGTSRVKTLKLIRNKLTDECLSKLLECCLECKVTTINLSQNSLTDYAIEILENAEYRDLRSITLNQNRINQRNAKPKIQELKRIGLTILV